MKEKYHTIQNIIDNLEDKLGKEEEEKECKKEEEKEIEIGLPEYEFSSGIIENWVENWERAIVAF